MVRDVDFNANSEEGKTWVHKLPSTPPNVDQTVIEAATTYCTKD